MDIWVFTHGSLMVDAPFPHRASRAAHVDGWQRTFGHPSVRNWGRPEHPAPTCSLIEGGRAAGVAYLVDRDVLAAIESREASEPRAVTVHLDDGPVTASTWTMTNVWSDWTPQRLAEAAQANIAAGGGPFGDAQDYLELVRSGLRRVGAADALVEAYHQAVLARLP